MIPLPFAGNNMIVRVVSINGGRGAQKKLYELGIYPGATLRVIKSWGPGPVIVELTNMNPNYRSSRVVIGYGLAMKILVEIM